MKSLAHYLNRISSIKVTPPSTLFDTEPVWSKLREGRCPICGSLLKKPRGKSISICYGKRHGDRKSFIIKNQTLAKYGYKYK